MWANDAFAAGGPLPWLDGAAARRPSASIWPAAASSSSRRRPASATFQPACASPSAVALPIPAPPPVTSANRSASIVPPLTLQDPFLAQLRRHAPERGGAHDRPAQDRRSAPAPATSKKHPSPHRHTLHPA